MKSIKYILWIFLLTLTNMSCTEELTDDLKDTGSADNGTMKFNFLLIPAAEVTVSRSIDASPIKDLKVFLFDEKGELMTDEVPVYSHEELTNGQDGNMYQKYYSSHDEYVYTGWIRLKLKTGYTEDSYGRIFLIANSNAQEIKEIYTEETLEKINSISKLEDLQTLVCEYKEGVFARPDECYLMTGAGRNQNGGLPSEYERARPLTDFTQSATPITLFRLDAKINFNITSGSGCSFKLESYEIHNVPRISHLFWKYQINEGGTIKEDNAIFGNDAAQETNNFYNYSPSIEGESNNGNATFSFHMAENLKKPKNFFSIDLAEKQKLNHRETNNYEDGKYSFTNAPDHATYVILKGTFTGSSKINNSVHDNVTANVRYIIHLGFSNQSGGTSSWNNYKGDVNDYLTRRNYLYNYNIKINGVNDISLEVINGTGEMSAAEGDITLKETITLSKNANTTSSFKLNPKETISLDNSNDYSWFQLARGISITDWAEETQSGAGGDYNFRISDNTEGAHEATFKAIRTSEDGRRKIIREITVTTGN